MKKLDLKALKLTSSDLLQREQLKSIFGGYGEGGGGQLQPGEYQCCVISGNIYNDNCDQCEYLSNPNSVNCTNGGTLIMCMPEVQYG